MSDIAFCGIHGQYIEATAPPGCPRCAATAAAPTMLVRDTNAVVRSILEMRVEALERECSALREICRLLSLGLHDDAQRILRPMAASTPRSDDR